MQTKIKVIVEDDHKVEGILTFIGFESLSECEQLIRRFNSNCSEKGTKSDLGAFVDWANRHESCRTKEITVTYT